MKHLTRCLWILLWLGMGGGFAHAQEAAASPKPPLALQVADPARRSPATIAVRNLSLSCFSDSRLDTDVVLSTIGTEYQEDGQTRFLPVLSLAFDREIPEGNGLEWMALWNLGQQPTGFWSNLRAILPFNRGKPSPQQRPPAGKVRLIEQLQSGQADGTRLEAPDPDLDPVRLWKASYAGLVSSSLRQTLGWIDVYNPSQFLYRAWLFRRRDLRARRFQETYQGLVWYLDAVDSTSLDVPRDTLAAIKFHLIRNRSTFGPWVSEDSYLESAWRYDSARRQRTISVSATLMTAANESGLGYEEFHQPVVNGTPTPVGGLLYYDPTVAPASEQARWSSPNLFDLGYNPFTDPRVQALARQHPNQRIPLGLYSYYAVLPRKPILLVDFFDPDNPRQREAAAVRMNLVREMLGAGPPGLVSWTIYKPVSYVANKKAFTPLANKVPAMGLEEFRLLLRTRLLFEPALADALLREVDKRELNPLMPDGETERLNAQIHYELLRGRHGAQVCQQVGEVRRRLYRQLSGRDAPELDPAQRAALRGWLEQERALHKLSRLAASDQVWEQLQEESAPALATLEAESLSPRLPTRQVLLRFARRLLEEQDRMGPSAPGALKGIQQRVEEILARAYTAEGKPPAQLARNLNQLRHTVAKERNQQEARLAKKQKKQFEQALKQSCEWLDKLEAKSDLRLVPAWRVESALEFLTQAPQAAKRNARLEPVLARYRERVERVLAHARQVLSQRAYEEEPVETARQRCLALLTGAEAASARATAQTQPDPNRRLTEE